MGTKQPRISVNELGRYMDTPNDLERRKIVKNQKNPNTHIGSYWNEAEKAISMFLLGGMTDREILVTAIERLHRTPFKDSRQEAKINYNIAAIEKIHESHTNIPIFTDMKYQRAPVKGWTLNLAGVNINIRPEVILSREGVCGAVKLFFGSRKAAISKESLDAIATLLHHSFASDGVAVKPSMCMLIDVFNQSCHVAPKSYKRTLHRLEATCKSVRMLWDSIEM